MSDLVRRSDVLDILGNVFATTLNVEVDVAIAAMMSKIKYMPKVEPDDTREAYNKGLEDGRNEVWELARKIVVNKESGGYSYKEMMDIFGDCSSDYVMAKYSINEVLAKLEAYEKKIEVGDVVRLKGSDKEYVVTTIDEDRCSEIYCGVSKDGRWFAQCNVEKTGKHIDIQSVLSQIAE